MNTDMSCSKINVDAGDATHTLKRFSNAFNASTATHTLDFKINRGDETLLGDRCKVKTKIMIQRFGGAGQAYTPCSVSDSAARFHVPHAFDLTCGVIGLKDQGVLLETATHNATEDTTKK